MVFAFNELSTSYVANNIASAHSWLNLFFSILDEVQKRKRKPVSFVSSIKFNNIYFNSDTSFSNWIKDLDVDFKRRILTMITKTPIKLDYPYYYHNNYPCKGLGFAFEQKQISISYAEEHWIAETLSITREQFDPNEDVLTDQLTVSHISTTTHLDIYVPQRLFVHHKKHDRAHAIANPGEEVSILECSHERALLLLCWAIGENSPADTRLYCYDEENNKYIVFNQHRPKEYHGYHTNHEAEIPHKVKELLKLEYRI